MGTTGRIIGRVSAVLDPVLSSAWLTRLVEVAAASSKTWWLNFRTPQPIEARRHGEWHRGTGLVDNSEGTIVRISLDD